MNIVLLVLKIIGITLLSILGVLLALIVLVLFVPIRYNITVSNNRENEKLYARVRVTWLLHFVNVLVSYYDELYYRVRLTFIKIISSDKKKKEERQKKQKKKKANADSVKKAEKSDDLDSSESTDIDSNSDVDDTKSSTAESGKGETIKELPESLPSDKVTTTEPAYDFSAEDELDDEPEQSFLEKAREIITKITEFLFNIPEKVNGVVEKVNDIKKNADYYIRAVNDERNKEAFSKCLNELVKILKSIRPRKIKGSLIVYRDDEYKYGQISSILSIVYPFISDKIYIETGTGKDITSYNIYIKGRITLFVLLVAFIRVYFNKDVKRMIRIFKHEGRKK